MNPKLSLFFEHIPKSDYEIVEIPNSIGNASMMGPAPGSSLSRFIIHSGSLRTIPIFEVTTLSLHEAVPGHHFAGSLATELKIPQRPFQGLGNYLVFVEGWALYAEHLGIEMGLYEDPLQMIGHLNDDMLRAVRLVVDTGIHALGWSREKAIEYMSTNLAMDPLDIEQQADRYAGWPGQALTYKVGQMKIQQLRKWATNELGPKFDLKKFHSIILGSGAVPMNILEYQVKAWVTSQKLQ